MPRSKRLVDLDREIEALRRQFLPDPFDPLGTYADSTRVQAHTRAFLVLSHAEMESYLEGWAKEIARAAELAWTSKGKVTTPFAFLLATLAERIEPPSTLLVANAKDSPQRFAEAAAKLFAKYYKQIKDNNGVKEKNVLALFAPLGIPASALGTTLLPNLDAFGAVRGAHAHQSAQAVRSVLDPETEHIRVLGLLGDVATLDQWLVRYKRRIR